LGYRTQFSHLPLTANKEIALPAVSHPIDKIGQITRSFGNGNRPGRFHEKFLKNMIVRLSDYLLILAIEKIHRRKEPMIGIMDQGGNKKRKKPQRRRRRTMEFEFEIEDQLSAGQEGREPAVETAAVPASAPEPEPDQPAKEKEAMPTETQARPRAAVNRRIDASRSVQRQVREQRTFNTLLSGAALTMISGILVVAGLAGLGGYVLYQQLQDQSATVAILEQNTKTRFYEMETDLIQRDTELARNIEQTNLRLMETTSSFENYRNETTEVLAEIQTKNQQLANALYRARKQNAEQEVEIARLNSITTRMRR
jgi:hypothetical protein